MNPSASSQQAAIDFLESIVVDNRGAGVFFGMDEADRGEVIGRFIEPTQDTLAIASVDGSGLKAEAFLSKLLDEFGYKVDLQSTDELLNMLRVFVVQQARARGAPILFLHNVDAMFPSALCVLCKLASQRAGDRFALRIVLVGDRYFKRIVESPSMQPVTRRLIGCFELKAHRELPSLIITHDGQTVADCELTKSRMLIGRSEFCDINIDSQCISRQHALLIQDESSLIVFDLRSRNGTFVNSERVTSRVLRDSDIIEVGDHRIKVQLPGTFAGAWPEGQDVADTARMKTLDDARREKGREDESLPGQEQRSG